MGIFRLSSKKNLGKLDLGELDLWNALKLAPVKVNDLWKKKCHLQTLGTTVSFALIFDNPYTQNEEVWIGNLGDLRAGLGIGLECQQLTIDARYRNEKEDLNMANKQFLTSIHLREGWVNKDEQNIYRLAGIVQPLRSIGHQDIKGFSSRPEI